MARWPLVLLVACSGGSAKPSSGPAFTPVLVNHLHAWADQCEIKQDGAYEVWSCTGLGTGSKITIDKSRHVVRLDLMLRSIMSDDPPRRYPPILDGIISKQAADTAVALVQKAWPTERATVDGVQIECSRSQSTPGAPVDNIISIRW